MTSEEFVARFRYSKGGLFSRWKDLSGSEVMAGDCQDFAWTVLVLERGGRTGAIAALKSGEAIIWRAKSPQNKWLPRHAVLWLKGRGWIDSTVRVWRDSPAPHKIVWPAYGRY